MRYIPCEEKGHHKVKWINIINYDELVGKCEVCELPARMHTPFFNKDFSKLILSILSYYYKKNIHEIPPSIKECIHPNVYPSHYCGSYISIYDTYHMIRDEILQEHYTAKFKEIVAEAFYDKFGLTKNLKYRLERINNSWFYDASEKLDSIFTCEDCDNELVHNTLRSIIINPLASLDMLFIELAKKKFQKLEVKT